MQIDAIQRTLMFVVCITALAVSNAHAQKQTQEPVLRVVKRPDIAPAALPGPPHALDPALKLAFNALGRMQNNVHDYTATLVKRERIDGRLGREEHMFVKIRNRKPNGTPLSIYMNFTYPEDVAGREVIWVENRNSNKLVAHDTGLLTGAIRVNLDPDGFMAMRGNKYPIYDAGLENLGVKLIEKAQRDREVGMCEVRFVKSVVDGRNCTMIEVKHPEKKEPYDFHIAKVHIDNELRIPIRYAAYSWPRRPGGNPVLEEEYTYKNVKLNVKLSDEDFNPDNPGYKFP